MKKYTEYLLLIFFILFVFCNLNAKNDWPVLRGPYLGQKPPGMTPEIFAPGIVSTGFDELFGCFSSDGKEFYYILGGRPVWVILVIKETNGIWTKPRVVPFSGQYGAKFCLSPDSNKVVLTSRHPLNGKSKPSKKLHTWVVERTTNGWGKPKLIKSIINALAPSLAANGNLYYMLGPQGKQEICTSKFLDGHYGEPKNLGDAVNSDRDESDPFVAPDESYIIFGSSRKEGDGLYICYKKRDGSWTKAKNMGSVINSFSGINVSRVSPDGKYLFFFSNESKYKPYSEKPLTYEEKIKILNGPGNGSLDIYWMSAQIIEDLKPVELKGR